MAESEDKKKAKSSGSNKTGDDKSGSKDNSESKKTSKSESGGKESSKSSGGKSSSSDSAMSDFMHGEDAGDDMPGMEGGNSGDAMDEFIHGDDENKKKSPKKTAQMLQAAGAAGGAALKAVMAMQLLSALKMFLAMLAALAQAAAAAVAGILAGIVNAIVAVATAVATALSVTVAVVLGGAAAVSIAVVLVIALFITQADDGTRDDGMDDCLESVEWLTPDDLNDVGGDTLTNAMLTYSVFKVYGLADENIAGILGNWEYESGIDPTGVETIYNEPFSIGPRKYDAWQGLWYNPVTEEDEVIDFRIDLYAPAYAERFPAIEYAGIGLGQWTNSRNRALMAYADSIGMPWYMMDTQLSFMISPHGDSSYYVNMLKNWQPEDSPESAAQWFNEHWEGITYQPVRGEAAARWFYRMGEWTADVSYANSIIAMAGAEIIDASESGMSSGLDGCSDVILADNSSLAAAMVAYSWLTRDEGLASDGTALYRCLHDTFWPGDIYYRSCDRGVAAAVLWSGTDDNFPRGATGQQLTYLSTSPNWVRVYTGSITPLDPDLLLPGDILIRWDGPGDGVHHIVMYVGNELIKAKWPHAPDDYVIAHASINTRSPNCGAWYEGSSGLQTYTVFRNIKKQENSIYENVTCAGMSGDSE